MSLFRRNPRSATIEAVYGAIVAQARAPVFYRGYGVPDTVNGRLDLLMLHLALVFERLSQGPQEVRAVGQAAFDRFCQDMDDHLREDGVGDLKVPKDVRKVASAFFGRHGAYIGALKAGDSRALEDALRRNVFGEQSADDATVARLTLYTRRAMKNLASQDLDTLMAGQVAWPDPETISVTASILNGEYAP